MRLFIVLLFLSICSSSPAMDGPAVYKLNCLTCHGEKMDGMGPAGQYMNPRPRNLLKDKFVNGDSPDQIYKTVSEGLPGTQMPSFGNLLDEDRRAVANYIASLRKK